MSLNTRGSSEFKSATATAVVRAMAKKLGKSDEEIAAHEAPVPNPELANFVSDAIGAPTVEGTATTTLPTISPTANPTANPTVSPTVSPTVNPTANPTVNVNVNQPPGSPTRSEHDGDGGDSMYIHTLVKYTAPIQLDKGLELLAQYDRDSDQYRILMQAIDDSTRLRSAVVDLIANRRLQENLNAEQARKHAEDKIERERLSEEARSEDARLMAEQKRYTEIQRRRNDAMRADSEHCLAEQEALTVEHKRKLASDKLEAEERRASARAELEAEGARKRQRSDAQDATIDRVAKAYETAVEMKTVNSEVRNRLTNSLISALGEEGAVEEASRSTEFHNFMDPMEQRFTACAWFKKNYNPRKVTGSFISHLRAETRKEFVSLTDVSVQLKKEILGHPRREGKTHVPAFPVSILRRMAVFARVAGERR